MPNLAEYRSHPAGLADFLPWAALVERGVVLNKDGSFQRTAVAQQDPSKINGVLRSWRNCLGDLPAGGQRFRSLFNPKQIRRARMYMSQTVAPVAHLVVDFIRFPMRNLTHLKLYPQTGPAYRSSALTRNRPAPCRPSPGGS
jgi:type IV secretion system protein TrbE